MLTGSEIKKRLGKGITITPFNESQLNPNSYNIRLHPELLVYEKIHYETIDKHGNQIIKDLPLDMKQDNPTKKIIIPESGLMLEPGTLYLGRTVEIIGSNNAIPCVDGRSSTGRLGINIHATAGFCDIGFEGTITLEISCVEPIIIYPNIEIGQVYFYEPVGDTDIKYNGRYQGQIDATASRFYKG